MNSLQDSYSSIIKALHEKGYKATPQIIVIGQFVLHTHAHPTAQGIYSEVKKVYPTVSLATIYKTVLNFERGRFDPEIEFR